MTDRLDIHIELDGQTVLVGTAHFTQRRGGEITTAFIYAPSYIAHPTAIRIDPNLSLVSGNQITTGLPGALQDTAPDRWGRNLIRKRHRSTAEGSVGSVAALTDVDFLTGVSDITRQGALRFTLPDQTNFIDEDIAVPKLIALPKLLHAVDHLDDEDDNNAAIKALLDAGSGSLGGARPKASVLGDDGRLLLAKFPHRNDEWDIMAWEKTALDIAERAGIDVPARRLVGLDHRHVLLIERFDRADGRRIPYISAMTLTNGRIGDEHDYADIAADLPDYGSNVNDDLAQLFRRAALNCAIHNTDDHLRNHGFLGGTAGWRLSPVFDINPNPDLNEGRVTSIGAATRTGDERRGLMMLAGDCRLDDRDARAIIAEVLDATAGWADIATANGISAQEQARFRPMFQNRAEALASPPADVHVPNGPASPPSSTSSEQGRRPKGTPAGGRFTNKNGSSLKNL